MIIDMDSTENEESERRNHLKRIMWRIIQEELTEIQRQTFLDYHIRDMTVTKIAAIRVVNRSTVSRTLKYAEQKIHRYTKYL